MKEFLIIFSWILISLGIIKIAAAAAMKIVKSRKEK